MRKKISFILIALTVLSIFIIIKPDAEAIPTFARKYNTSCSTCHVAIFRRNEFGDAFRRNGYQWPGAGQDEKKEVEKRIPLKGSNAFGVGALPQTLPFSVYGHQRITYDSSTQKSSSVQEEKAEFDPHELELLIGGTLGKDISFFTEWLIWEKGHTDDGRLGEMWIMFDNLLGRALNIKIGRLTQSLSLYKENDRLTLSHYYHNDYKVNDFKLRNKRHGIEANGIVADRVAWAAGVCDNNDNFGDNKNDKGKDFYGSLNFRLSGMTFTGKEPNVDFDNPSFFDFLTLTVGGYAYFGTESAFDDSSAGGTGEVTGENEIQRYGVDLDARYKRVTIQAGFLYGIDDDRDRDGTNTEVTSLVYIGEIDLFVMPWLIFVYRYERSTRTDTPVAGAETEETLKFHSIAGHVLLRENIRLTVEGFIKENNDADETVKFNILYAF